MDKCNAVHVIKVSDYVTIKSKIKAIPYMYATRVANA